MSDEMYKVHFIGEETGDKGVVVKRYRVMKLSEDFEPKGSYDCHEVTGNEVNAFCNCPSPQDPCKHIQLLRVARAQYPDPEVLGSKFWAMEKWAKNIREIKVELD